MYKGLLLIAVITLFGCKLVNNEPILKETKIDYTFIEEKYALIGDSVANYKSFRKHFSLEIKMEATKLYAYWTEKIPSWVMDSTNSQLESILRNKEFVNTFTFKFVLNENGGIDSLENWPEFKLYVDSLTKIYYKNSGFNQDEIERINPLLKVYQSKERLLNKTCKAMVAFHNLYDFGSTFEDTLVNEIFGFELNNSTQITPATIYIRRPNDYLVDYRVVSEYDGNSDIEMIEEFEKFSIKDSSYNQLKSTRLKDTVYYRFNLDSNQIENILIKRHAFFDTLHFVSDIQLKKGKHYLK